MLLVLCACARDRADPRLAEITTPLHATIRVIDAPRERTCAGTFVEQLTCLTTRAARQGCVYIEVGAAADAPEFRRQADPIRCVFMDGLDNRATLAHQPARKATLFVDPTGERLVVDLVDSVHAVYLRKGQLVTYRHLWDGPTTRPGGLMRPDGTLNWALIPPYLAVLDALRLEALSEAELDDLLATTSEGKNALKQSLRDVMESSDVVGDHVARALLKLDEVDRVQLKEHLFKRLASGDFGMLAWFLAHPEQQTPEFLSALERGVTTVSGEDIAGMLALGRLAPERAERIACESLEQTWLRNRSDGYVSFSPDEAALGMIVSRKSKCPWVMPLLEQNTCSQELRCDPFADDHLQTPLCTAAQSASALRRTFDPEAEPVESDWGALLIAAAQLQGPLPASFKFASDRRQYALSYTFLGSEADDPCRHLSLEPAAWGCNLPAPISAATIESCRLVIDDTKKTLTLTPVERWEATGE